MPTLTCPTPTNTNPLRLTGYQFSIAKLPDLHFFVQEVEIPSIQLGVTIAHNSVHDIKIPGETMEYSELTMSFIVDEEMRNWNSVYHWMIGLGYPAGHQLYSQFVESAQNSGISEISKGYSDGFLTVLDNTNNPKQTFMFHDCFPISLSGLRYDLTQQEGQIAVASVTFAYTFYTINKEPTNY